MAAYFAVACPDAKKTVRIYALDRTTAVVSPEFITSSQATMEDLANEAGTYLVEAPTLTPRIGAQRGLFTFHGRPNYRLSGPDTPTFLKAALKFDISPDDRNFFRQRLYHMGIDALQLMADLDGMCSSLGWWYHSGLRSPTASGAVISAKGV